MIQELVQEIENAARDVVNDVHTALPGEIISFDATKCTALVQPLGKFVTTDGTELAYPKIADVPVMFPFCHTAGVGIAFPVKDGDSCLIIISEVELDEWRSGAESEGPLRFDLTNAIAIPGLLREGNDLITDAMKNDAVVIRSVEAEVMVKPDSVKVSVGLSHLSVSSSGITAGGNLTVQGNISYTGSISRLE